MIPLVDLKAQYAAIRGEIDSAMRGVMERAEFILGAEVEAFEGEFAAYVGTGRAIGCANGTDALQLALRALGVGPGDEVIVPAMTFAATALAVRLVGATPVLVDVTPDAALIDVPRVHSALTPRTRAIIPVHLFGQCVELDELLELADRHRVPVVEDAAQAHGAVDATGRRAGSVGELGCFSFYPGKNLGAAGDAGAVVTSNPDLAERLLHLRNCGSIRKYFHEMVGTNSRLDALQAAILRVKLRHLDAWNAARRAHAARYDVALQGIAGLQTTTHAAGSAYHLYVVRVPDRDAALTRLRAEGIGASIHYPFALHQLAAFPGLGSAGSFPVAEDWAARGLSLPLYPEMPEWVPERAAAILAGREGP